MAPLSGIRTRDDSRRTRLQQAVGEAAGRCSDVDAVTPFDDHAQRVECVLQLLPAARHEARRPLDLEHRVLVELLTRLVVPWHQTRENQRLRLRAGLHEPTLDQQDVEPLLHAVLARSMCCAVPSSSWLARRPSPRSRVWGCERGSRDLVFVSRPVVATGE